jgi:hypothetical protein
MSPGIVIAVFTRWILPLAFDINQGDGFLVTIKDVGMRRAMRQV